MKDLINALKMGNHITVATVDLETLALTPTAKVMTAAYIIATISDRGGHPRTDVLECSDYVRSDGDEDPATVKWHSDDPARSAVLAAWDIARKTPFDVVMRRMANDFNEYGVQALFIQGKDFDLPIIGNALPGYLQEFQELSDIKYYDTHCLRDVVETARCFGFIPPKRARAHTALSDCKDNLTTLEAFFAFTLNRR